MSQSGEHTRGSAAVFSTAPHNVRLERLNGDDVAVLDAVARLVPADVPLQLESGGTA